MRTSLLYNELLYEKQCTTHDIVQYIDYNSLTSINVCVNALERHMEVMIDIIRNQPVKKQNTMTGMGSQFILP